MGGGRKIPSPIIIVITVTHFDQTITMKPYQYEPRFMSQAQLTELLNLWHLAKTARYGGNRHDQLTWATNEFHKLYPDISTTAAWKDLTAQLEGY